MDTGSASSSRSTCSRKPDTSRRWSRSIARPRLTKRWCTTRFSTCRHLLGPRVMNMPPTNRSIPTLSSEKIDVRYVAKLARIALTDDEVERFETQLGDLLEHVNALGKLDVSQVAATAQVVESRNVERADELVKCLDRETVLAQAPQRQGAFFRVPRIIAE